MQVSILGVGYLDMSVNERLQELILFCYSDLMLLR
jgi:hypothetical protein